MKVKFVKAWQNYQVGNEIEPPGVLRQWLLANKYVEPVAMNESCEESHVFKRPVRRKRVKADVSE